MLQELRREVWQANRGLARDGLVVGTSGNASGRDPGTGLVVIKPSGVAFEDLEAHDLVVVEPDGAIVEGDLKPSVDTPSHLYVYRHLEAVHGVVHTHSAYATSFAARGESIEVFTTTHAALFGGPIPVTDYAVIGEEEVGRQIVEHIGEGSSVLLRSHGVFTVGANVDRALRAALYTEESAECAHLAMVRGEVEPLPAEVIAASREWYLSDYGQRPVGSGT